MPTQPSFSPDESYAHVLDDSDPLAEFRHQFHIPRAPQGQPLIYLCGNSLGPMPKSARAEIEQFLEQWEKLGVRGHFAGERPWLSYPRLLTEPLAQIVGGQPDEVITMGTLTSNIHLMLATFYQPQGQRRRIVALDSGFPSDRYALHSMLALRGQSPAEIILPVVPRPGEHLVNAQDIETILDARGDEIALVFLPGVHYATGQRFDIGRITRAAHARGCLAGFDLAHAVGNVPLQLHDWAVDFAIWCGYKYLSGGAGLGAGCFVHQIHVTNPDLLHLAGWWGNDPATRFEMRYHFEPVLTAERFQVSCPSVLSLAPLIASLRLFQQAGLERIWEKSRRLTAYLEYLLRELPEQPFEIITPSDPDSRGNQISILLQRDAAQVAEVLLERGVVIDERPPNLIRVAPVPLFSRFHEVWQFVQTFGEVISS
jgi:kynureninase